jgi:large subunit ribosomal protein L25
MTSTEPPSRSGSGSDGAFTTGSIAAAILNNPFVPHKNPKSGRWAPPKYSLRRQAELIKHARESGMLHLLPPGLKLGEVQLLQYLTATETETAGAADAAEQEKQAQTQAQEREREEFVANGLVSVRRKQGQGQEQRLEEEMTQGPSEDDDGPRLGQKCKNNKDVGAAPARVDDSDDAWTRSVEWIGTIRERNVAGADVGNRLYAGKKRMFKGHKWERQRERRVARTKMLLRDMDKRVQRFKEVRVRFYCLILSSLPHTHTTHTFFFVSPASISFFLLTGFLSCLVPCQGQAVAAGKEVQRVEEDAEAAVLTPRLTTLQAFAITILISSTTHPLVNTLIARYVS